MENLSRDAKRYLRQVRGWLPCAGKMKKNVLVEIRGTLAAFCAENPDEDYQSIVARFGTPQQIASAYVDEAETGDLIQKLRIRRRIVAIVATTAAMLVLLWAGVVTMAYVQHLRSVNGFEVVEIAELN